MKTIGNIQSQANAEVFAVASGALPDGKPVIVNSNGTVSVISGSSATQNIGSEVIYEAGDSSQTAAVYDPSINRIVIAFMDDDNSQDGTAVVGTVSGDSVLFGTPTVFSTAALQTSIGIVYDASAGKVVVFYQGASSHGKARVCTVDPSDNSITFGTEASFNAASTNYIAASYDSNAQKTVIQYQHSSTGVAIVGTVSGTDINFGSSTQFSSSDIVYGSNEYDSTAQKVIIAYRGASNYGRARVATISGTSVSFGTEVVFESATSNEMKVSYDANVNRTVIVYSDQGNSNQGTAIVGTVSGTDISFGTAVVFNADTTATTSIVYDSTAKKVVIAYPDGDGDGSDNGKLIVGTVSGTSISFGTPVVFEAGIVGNPSCFISSAFDSTANRCVIAYGDRSDSNKGKAVVFQNTFTSTNVTTENFLGFTGGEVDYTTFTQASGTPVAYESDSVEWQGTAYDSNSNRVVVAYVDTGDSGKGKAVVGTVNAANNSISFGTPVVFESSDQPRYCAATFDSNSNKVIILYSDGGNSSYGTALVGTVDSSDNSISFGSEVVFESAAVDEMNATFDSNANKVVIAYRDKGNSNRGTAIVGTVSGTSISFGTAVVFLSEDSRDNAISFDSTANKVVIAYADNSSTFRGTAIVGTVSGTGISFGSQAVFANASTVSIGCTYDSNSNKTVIAYADAQEDGTAIVATVSGTSISFGTAVEFDGDASLQNKIVFDSNVNKVVNMYRDGGNSNRPTMIVGTVSGTSISFETAVTLSNSGSNYYASVFDTTSKKVIAFYQDDTNTAGTAAVFQAAGLVVTRPEIADGKLATIQVGGSINTQQNALTAGQQYFVQTDGTIGTTAASPSVIAGTAVSATDLIVKG